MSTENVALVRNGSTPITDGTPGSLLHCSTPRLNGAALVLRYPVPRRYVGEMRWSASCSRTFLGAMPDFRVAIEEIRDLPGDQVLLIAQYEGHGGASGAAFSHDSAAIFRFRAGVITFFQDFAVRDQALQAVGLKE